MSEDKPSDKLVEALDWALRFARAPQGTQSLEDVAAWSKEYLEARRVLTEAWAKEYGGELRPPVSRIRLTPSVPVNTRTETIDMPRHPPSEEDES